ncbi:N-acetyl-gamma-glutamyl-phosphate reductase [Brachyspira pilosicoli]|uniref:N-acetyl-gamma-glutamyl-phosphate reductase n=1 Tax=Brachyspira pilosicoli TaxID=52584 RepID=UPI00300599DF
MIKVSVIGATGYAGAELIRLLLSHSKVELKNISSKSFVGKNINEVYPNLNKNLDKLLIDENEIFENTDVVFASLPAGLSDEIANKCFEKNILFIDLGADFRLDDEEDYKNWYGKEYKYKNLHKEAIYSIPEIIKYDNVYNKKQLKNAKIIGNPGCYPTSIGLALAPALVNKLIQKDDIIIDSKSGATGAGRELKLNTHYTECNEAFAPYKIAEHRHTPEIEQTLSNIYGEDIKVTFVPHLLPLNRGIVSTIYAKLENKNLKLEDIHNIYKEFYKDSAFVRVLNIGEIANLKYVKYSNYCDISLHIDNRTNKLIIVSTIDNMVKGAAGQAIQNMNIALGLEEAEGLNFIPPAF